MQQRGPSPEREGAIVVGTAVALPQHRYEQMELAEAAEQAFPALSRRKGLLARFFESTGVRSRHLALPKECYSDLGGMERRNRVWMEVALPLGERALLDAVASAGLSPGDISALVTTTVTGLSVPSLDARLMNRIPFDPGLRRVPLFGLGCAGGVAGLACVDDYLRAHPERAAALLAVELCSLTIQPEDASVANILSSGLFGDGAAAVIAVGAEHPSASAGAPSILATRAHFLEETEDVMGWEIVDRGFRIVLSPEVPEIARSRLPGVVRSFLREHGRRVDEIDSWVSHPGGPKVMDAIEDGLALERGTLDRSRESLRDTGNLSSASVLSLLDSFRRQRRPSPGAHGLMIAMGPAFAVELALLRW